jgi:hypothetical protein
LKCSTITKDKPILTNQKHIFNILSRDKKGGDRRSFEDIFEVDIVGPTNVLTQVVSNGDSSYSFVFPPKATGKYVITAQVNSKNIKGSPFIVHVEESSNNEKSSAEGACLVEAISGEETKLVVTLRDKEGKVRVQQDEIFVLIESPPIEPKFTITQETESTLMIE